jgi:hypothetical protein
VFLIFGISSGRKKLDFHQAMVCAVCGGYGRYEVFMEYMYFSLFFLPIFKWNKTYYVKSSCCGSIYRIDKELGGRIARGENVTLREEDLQPVQTGHKYGRKRCSRCGFETEEDYQYCPKCSNPLS